MIRLQMMVASILLADSPLPSWLAPIEEEAAILKEPTWQRTEGMGIFWPKSSEELRPLVHELVRNCILPMAM